MAALINRIKELRQRHGWSAERLAEEMKRAGIPWERQVVTKLENGKRASVSLEELLALAYVLDVAPVHLMVPTDAGTGRYQITPTIRVSTMAMRSWIRGQGPIGEQDMRTYLTEVPPDEFRSRVAGLPAGDAEIIAAIGRGGDPSGD